MSAGAFDLGSYGAEIVLNTSSFETSMQNAEQQMTNNENKTKGWAGNLGTIAAGAVAGLGLALTGAAVAGVKMADDLNKALNGLQASTGSTDEEMKGMEESLKNIYNNNFGESFDDIAQSMALVKQNTGLAGKELEGATQNALMLRDTFDMDVAESTNAANSLMKQFGISSTDAFNLIAQGAQNGANKNGDLIDSLNEYAPQFAAMGFSSEQFTNVLIDGAKNGAFSIDKIGDAMKEFNIRSKDMSATSMDAFKSLGLNGEQMSASFAKGGESAQKSFNQVMTSLNSIKDPVEKNRIGVELFGTQFEDLEAKGIASLANIGTTASLSKDALGKINEVKYDSLGEAFEGIKRNLMTGLLEPMQQNVLPILGQFADWIQSHMPQIKEGINSAMEGAKTVFEGLKDAVGFVIDNMNILLPVVGGLTAAFAAQMIINTLVGLYNAWKAATVAQTTVQWLLNAAMNANPIGLVALAIGALIAVGIALYQNWDTVTQKLGQFWNWIKTTAVNIFNGIVDFFKKWGSTILKVVTGPIGILVGLISKNWDSIKSTAMKVWNSIKDFFSTTVGGIYNLVKGKFDSMVTTLSNIFGNILSKAKDIWGKVKSFISETAGNIKSTISDKFNSVLTTVSSIFGNILSKAKDIFGKIKNAITSPIQTAKETVVGIIDKIKGAFNFKWSLPKLKLPHVSVTMKKNSVGIPYPDFDVSWWARGGIADKSMFYGVGEAGKEAIIPLENPAYMAPFADAVFNRLVDRLSSTASTSTNNTSNNEIILNNSFSFTVNGAFSQNDAKNASDLMFKQLNKGFKERGFK